MWRVLQVSNKNNKRIFLVANKSGLSGWQETARVIEKIYPKLKIVGADISLKNKDNQRNLIRELQMTDKRPDVVFCNFGAPYQEKFIAKLKKSDVNIKLAVGVGGSFDFISGNIARAPKWLRVLGLEWLWRLFQQPHRWRRIFKAVIIFPIKIILNRK